MDNFSSTEQLALGRRAMDKVLAQLASRTTADINQAGAMPAIVILGDNNVLCMGDAFMALLQERMKASALPPMPPAPPPPAD